MIDITTLEFSSLSIFIMIAIACVAVAILVMNIIKYRGRKSFEKLIVSLAERADSARNEFESLFVPSRLVEERQIDDFKTKYADLLVDIENVKGHKYFDEEPKIRRSFFNA